ncbi:MAG: sigma-54-dependent Fis family transcriptional regulator [Anaeromyxobacter sp.]|nr:sigma-54-dependent Fis family transcriptional regulator [Anaeromyxobacter sp.]MBL0277259.1 sigma-54-dependent Fis family transcriptional regulator [Anaeromyxobacter sp.]
MATGTILLVDDEPNIRRALRLVLEPEGFTLLDAESGEAALKVLEAEPVDLGLFDIRLGGLSGLDLLSRARELWRDLPVIVISGHAEAPDIVTAMRRGAVDFLQKPLDRERVLVSVRNALERKSLGERVQALAARGPRFQDEMVGDSPAMASLREAIAKVAPTNGRVLVLGESGTGKELIAQEIHRRSKRAGGPFVKVNCAAIPAELIESELFGHEKGSFTGAGSRRRGQFEVADGGTLFLDEIGDMSPPAQAKVLRALQTGEVVRVGSEKAFTVDVRVVAATHQDLATMVREGTFREDLYFRLNVVPLRCPALRERLDDVPGLAERFVTLACRENGLAPKRVAPEVYQRLKAYRWPGNVRELRNVCERMAIMSGDQITAADVPADVGPRAAGGPLAGPDRLPDDAGLTLNDRLDRREREYIQLALESHDWNITQAAQSLGLDRTHLHKKLKQHGLSRAHRGASPEGAEAEAEG